MARRKEPVIPDTILGQLLAGSEAKSAFDSNGLIEQLKKALAERALNAEMDHHLSNDSAGGNSRNGYGKNTVLTDNRSLELSIPRDRQSSFDPQLLAKYQRRFPGFNDKIISMYARGMSTREIVGHVRNKAVHVPLGVRGDGTKEILGLWIEGNEGAKFWLRVMNELKNRGVEDILIAVVDGLKGLPNAVNAVFPETTVQTCIVHLLRNSLDFASWKDRKDLAREMKAIYAAIDDKVAEAALISFENSFWFGYPPKGMGVRTTHLPNLPQHPSKNRKHQLIG